MIVKALKNPIFPHLSTHKHFSPFWGFSLKGFEISIKSLLIKLFISMPEKLLPILYRLMRLHPCKWIGRKISSNGQVSTN